MLRRRAFRLAASLLPLALPAAVCAEEVELEISGETRVRLEGVDGQFRAGRTGDDHLLLIRTTVLAEADFGVVTMGGELMDSRTYLADDETPISASFANPGELLQLYAEIKVDDLFIDGSTSRLKIGRQTVSIGSKRQIERPDFANVARSYTGAYLRADLPRGDELHALLVVPVERLPSERERVEVNDVQFDEEEWNRIIWGLHYRRADLLPGVFEGLLGRNVLLWPSRNRHRGGPHAKPPICHGWRAALSSKACWWTRCRYRGSNPARHSTCKQFAD